jgi:NADH-quinone oxidoreductase subunit D
VGDSWDRFVIRVREMRESVKILRQCFKQMPEGPIMGKVPRIIKPPKGEAYGAVESARGELGYYVISDGTRHAYRIKIRTGSFAGMSIIEHTSKGIMIADLVALIAGLDVIAPEIDR